MSNSFVKSSLFAALILVLTGCASTMHSGAMSSSASLSSSNFAYVGQAQGQATVSYVLTFGGSRSETLVDAAKKNLLASISLGNNQALANVTVNFKTTSTLGVLYREVTCIVTADIVEFKN